jgi:hypothetical protein
MLDLTKKGKLASSVVLLEKGGNAQSVKDASETTRQLWQYDLASFMDQFIRDSWIA